MCECDLFLLSCRCVRVSGAGFVFEVDISMLCERCGPVSMGCVCAGCEYVRWTYVGCLCASWACVGVCISCGHM